METLLELEKSTSPRCILIDDDPIYNSIMLRCAEQEKIDLEVFSSLIDMGFVGLLGRYDVAIVDYDLGQMTGLEIAQYLTALFGDIPMILVSAKERTKKQTIWPKSIKAFVHKSRGYSSVLKKAKSIVKTRK